MQNCGLSNRNAIRFFNSEYLESTILYLIKNLKDNNYQSAVEIASIPELIRGYDIVKEESVEKAKKLQIQHMNDFNNGKIEVVKTYEPNEAIGGK